MKKILNQLLITVVLVSIMLAGFRIFEGSTYPENMKKSSVVRESEEKYDYYKPVPIPEHLKFAGENVPLEYFDVKESLDRELLVNSYFHSQTLRYLKMAPRYFDIIEPILKADTVPLDFKYLALAESGFDPRAASPAGAVGFWQFVKGTATDYGLEVNDEVDERYHIELSTHAACRYLKDAYKQFGSWTLVAASFNGGKSFIEKQMRVQKVQNYYDLLVGQENGRYVFRILALKLIMENPELYGFKVEEKDKYPVWNTKEIDINTPVSSFADFARLHGTNYKILKMLNPWLREDHLTNTKRKTYSILLPVEGFRNVKK